MSACTERPKLVVNRTSDSKKKTSRSHFGASPFASPMAYRLAIAEGMPSLSHAQSTPSVLPALILSRARPEISFYILGSIPIFSTIFRREPQAVIINAPLAYTAITRGSSVVSFSSRRFPPLSTDSVMISQFRGEF